MLNFKILLLPTLIVVHSFIEKLITCENFNSILLIIDNKTQHQFNQITGPCCFDFSTTPSTIYYRKQIVNIDLYLNDLMVKDLNKINTKELTVIYVDDAVIKSNLYKFLEIYGQTKTILIVTLKKTDKGKQQLLIELQSIAQNLYLKIILLYVHKKTIKLFTFEVYRRKILAIDKINHSSYAEIDFCKKVSFQLGRNMNRNRILVTGTLEPPHIIQTVLKTNPHYYSLSGMQGSIVPFLNYFFNSRVDFINQIADYSKMNQSNQYIEDITYRNYMVNDAERVRFSSK